MNEEELIVNRFLVNQGFKSIVFEPNGNSTPPDFVIDNNISVEVRRMNKHLNINGIMKALEETKFQFEQRFEKLLAELENPTLPFSIGVTLRYKRPIKISKELIEAIKNSIRDSTKLELFRQEVLFNEQISYVLFKSNLREEKTYRLIITHDNNRGGNVQKDRYEALKICVEDKEKKLRSVKNDYAETWLILVDDIFSRVDYTTKLDFQRFPEIKSYFNRIVMISKYDESNWIDIYPWK